MRKETTTLTLSIDEVVALRVALSESATDEPDPAGDRLYDRLTAAANRLGYEVPA